MAATATRRTEGLIVRQVGAETVVFDTRTEQVSCLDAVTARVWEVLDGERTIDQLATASDLPQEEVVVALARLSEAGLLVEATGFSRRSLLRGVGTAAAAAPLLTVLAPTPAFAQSGGVIVGRSVVAAAGACTVAPSNRSALVAVTLRGFPANTTITLEVLSGTTVRGTATVVTDASGSATTTVTANNLNNGLNTLTVRATFTSGGTTTTTTSNSTTTTCAN